MVYGQNYYRKLQFMLTNVDLHHGIRAGYKTKSPQQASEIGCQLLKKTQVQEAKNLKKLELHI